jgi:uncharacterized protein (TIGR00255 family)
MIKSMTGFGRGEYSTDGREYVVEIKTVNHRYLETSVRLPRQYSFLEDVARKAVSKVISRGKVDVSIQFNNFGSELKQVSFDENLIKTYLEEAKILEGKLSLKNDLSFCRALQLPEVVKVEAGENEEEIIKEFSFAISSALDKLKQMRETEGMNLRDDILGKCDNLLSIFSRIESSSKIVVDEYRVKLNDRINELLKDTNVLVDQERMATEVAIFADRASIDEEIVRFRSHVEQIKSTMKQDESIGKKLDFIVQELNRETNTNGSKANDLEISQAVIELKNEIEKIREQIQNIE